MKYYNQHNKSKGFTLIELLVVISIISLLSSVVLVSLNSTREKARKTAFVETLKQTQTALEIFKTSNGNYPNEDIPYTVTNAGGDDAISVLFSEVGLIPTNIPSAPQLLFPEDTLLYATGIFDAGFYCDTKAFSGYILIYLNSEGSGGINLPGFIHNGYTLSDTFCVTGN
jgi:prepilin-type N-terminal cleavage/methylation domain-containing protein